MIVGTAGHIDHGKTSLVRLLTGIDTDRLPEEKKRGMTINLGFAHTELGGVGQVGIVDVPGHERFIRNMVAGASGIDVVLLVIAADDGVMPQTREHLDIISLLGITNGVVALTKIDLAAPDRIDAVSREIRALLKGTVLASAPLVPVSSKSGEGLEALRQALADGLAAVRTKSAAWPFWMPVDRVFVVSGFGIVATGTIESGRVVKDANLRILPGRQGSYRQHSAGSGSKSTIPPGGCFGKNHRTRTGYHLSGTVAGRSWKRESQSRILRGDEQRHRPL